MATCNFRETPNFPLWAIADDAFEDEGGGYDPGACADWHAYALELVAQLNNEMPFRTAKLVSGYYSGVQLLTEADDDPESLDNDETQHYFGMCRSAAVRAYRREARRVNKTLDRLAPEYGFAKYAVAARFGNDETWYTVVNG